jgi:type IV pilus assembly protein PilN
MHIDINLATHPYQDAHRFWKQWGLGLSALGILTLLLVYTTVSGFISARSDHNLIKQREQQIAERDRERANAERLLNLPENRSTRDRSQFINELFQRKSFSWTRVFEDLERVMPPRLHVVSIRPALAPDNQLEIKLVVAGDSSDRALELVRRMESSQRFQQTLIEQWRNQQSQGPGDAVQFDITALYVPEPGPKAETKRSTP